MDRREQDELIARIRESIGSNEAGKARKNGGGGSGPDWLKLCVRGEGKRGPPLAILENAYIALSNDLTLKDKFKFDAMLRRPMIINSAPRPVTDDDVLGVGFYLGGMLLRRFGLDVVLHNLLGLRRLV